MEESTKGDFEMNFKPTYLNYLYFCSFAIRCLKCFKVKKEHCASKLPVGFDSVIYLALNPDLKDSRMAADEHYLKYGRNEFRPYRDVAFYINNNFLPRDFNEDNYIYCNPDVGKRNVRAIDHYLLHGYREHRVYKINDSI